MPEIEMLAEAGDAPEGAPASGADLRRRLVDCILERGGENVSAAFDRFLAEDDWKRSLAEWLPDTRFDQPRSFDAVRATLARDIAAIDALLGDQIDEVLHAPAFKAIEAAWRGVELLVQAAGDDDKLRVRLFNATWLELSRDFERSIEFDQSTLFSKVYNEEYGMPGGLPYGLLVFDYAVRHRSAPNSSADDVSTLSGIAQVAAASFSPSVIGAAPELFGLTTFADLSYAQRLDSGFRLGEYHRWRKLRERDDSRFVGVVLPRILMRDRYRDNDARLDGFRYAEGGSGVESWLWGNASFAYGVVAIRAFRKWGWFADICGTRGGLIDDLPAPDFSTRESIGYRRPLEVELTDKKQKVLEDLGFISISPCSFTREVVLLGTQSLRLLSGEGGAVEQTNDGISSMLHYVMCVSRFAHYVKVMARDRVGAYATPYDLERYLDEWLRNYTIGNSDAGLETKARHPLSGARVEVREVPGRPGMMSCTMHLSPHFQFDQVVSGFRMRTEIHGTRSR